MDDSIYGDIGEYKPSRRFDQGASSSKADENQGKHRYFDKSNEEEERETGTIQSKFKHYGYVRLSKKNFSARILPETLSKTFSKNYFQAFQKIFLDILERNFEKTNKYL